MGETCKTKDDYSRQNILFGTNDNEKVTRVKVCKENTSLHPFFKLLIHLRLEGDDTGTLGKRQDVS